MPLPLCPLIPIRDREGREEGLICVEFEVFRRSFGLQSVKLSPSFWLLFLLGAAIYIVHRILGFFDPLSPLCPQNLYCLSTNFVHYSPPPSARPSYMEAPFGLGEIQTSLIIAADGAAITHCKSEKHMID